MSLYLVYIDDASNFPCVLLLLTNPSVNILGPICKQAIDRNITENIINKDAYNDGK